MKHFFSLIAFVVAAYTFGQNPDGFDKMLERYLTGSVPLATPQQLHYEMSRTNDLYILDTRQKKEYEVSHIKGARFVGYDNFKLSSLKDIPKSSKIYLYCAIGYRSEKVGDQLKAAGYTKLYNIYGGIFNWVNSGYPVYTKEGEKATRVHGYNKKWSKWINEKKSEIVLN